MRRLVACYAGLATHWVFGLDFWQTAVVTVLAVACAEGGR